MSETTINHTNRLIRNPWLRRNDYIYSHVKDFTYSSKEKTFVTGLKYVIKGEEFYRFNGRTHVVKQGQCLVINEGQKIDILTKNSATAEGICINLDSVLLNDVYKNYIQNNENLMERVDAESNQFEFCEVTFSPDDVLCKYLDHLAQNLDRQTGAINLPREELFFTLAERLLFSQSIIKVNTLKIKACKNSTRLELYKRLNFAKQRLDEEVQNPTSITTLASDAALSEFHFFRTFKQAFGISPYQYQLKRRLENAKTLLVSEKKSVSEAAYFSGFADVPGFCRAFKKEFSISPGEIKDPGIQRQNRIFT